MPRLSTIDRIDQALRDELLETWLQGRTSISQLHSRTPELSRSALYRYLVKNAGVAKPPSIVVVEAGRTGTLQEKIRDAIWAKLEKGGLSLMDLRRICRMLRDLRYTERRGALAAGGPRRK